MVTVLSLGFIVLGIGCTSWVIINMWAQAQSDHYADTTSTTLAEEQNQLMEGSTPVESDTSIVLPALDKTLYPLYPAEGDNIGSLTIPALKRKLPIIQGTGDEELSKGVGHFTKSVLPGEEDNCVLSGHRDTVFRQLGNLKIGDQLIVKTSAGTFTYEVEGTRIVHKDDKTVIVPTDHAVLSVITCYPFYFIGDAPDRYVISAALVKSIAK
ncbi:MAG TPA: class D sortase [Ruminiclostridium sp.]